MLPFQQRKFGMVAMAEFSPARRVNGSVWFHKQRTHQRTRLPVRAWLSDGLLHHLDCLLHHLARIELSLGRSGTGYHGKRDSIEAIPVQPRTIFNPKDPSAAPHVRANVTQTVGTISLTGSVTAGSRTDADAWAKDKRQLAQGYLDVYQMRCSNVYPPLDGSTPVRYRTEFTFSARTVQS